jgi:hypothetical protein
VGVGLTVSIPIPKPILRINCYIATMEKWAKIYHQYKSLIVCSEVTLLLILVGYFEGIIWIIAPIIFPLFFVFIFVYVDKGVWQRHNLLMYCTLIPAFFIGIIKFGNGSHDSVGKVLIQIAHSATFLLSFIMVAVIKINSIANTRSQNEDIPNWRLALKPIFVMLIAFTGSYLLMTYLNYNL